MIHARGVVLAAVFLAAAYAAALAQFTTLGAGGSGPHIALSATSIVAGSANGTTLGTASISGTYTGTPTWSITDATGTFQINSSTGVVTVLSNTQLTFPNTISIVIGASGTTPAMVNATFPITVLSSQSEPIPVVF